MSHFKSRLADTAHYFFNYLAAHGLAAQGLAAHGFLAAQGFFAAHGLAAQGFFAAHGLAAQGFFAAHGLAAQGFFAAHGLAAQGFFAAHGLAAQGFFAAHGLAAQGFFAAHGLAEQGLLPPLMLRFKAVFDAGPAGVTMCSHVPLGAYVHALPWKSAVEVPWQLVPGPAAQSFSAARAIPKHLSLRPEIAPPATHV